MDYHGFNGIDVTWIWTVWWIWTYFWLSEGSLWWLKPAVELLENTCPLLVANDCRSGHMKFPTVPLFMQSNPKAQDLAESWSFHVEKAPDTR